MVCTTSVFGNSETPFISVARQPCAVHDRQSIHAKALQRGFGEFTAVVGAAAYAGFMFSSVVERKICKSVNAENSSAVVTSDELDSVQTTLLCSMFHGECKITVAGIDALINKHYVCSK